MFGEVKAGQAIDPEIEESKSQCSKANLRRDPNSCLLRQKKEPYLHGNGKEEIGMLFCFSYAMHAACYISCTYQLLSPL